MLPLPSQLMKQAANLGKLYSAVFGEREGVSGALFDLEDAIVIRGVVQDVLLTLSPREEKVIQMRLGLFRSGKALTQAAVADHFGVSRERIRYVERKALRKLRHPSRAAALQAVAQLIKTPDQVEELHLSDLSLTEIPAFLAKFRNTRALFLEQNRLESLPDFIEGWSRLEEINLSKNGLHVFPQLLLGLPSLKTLGSRRQPFELTARWHSRIFAT